MHFCERELVSFSLFGKAEPCEHFLSSVGMELSGHPPGCPMLKNKKKGCCDDRHVVVDAVDYESALTQTIFLNHIDAGVINSPVRVVDAQPHVVTSTSLPLVVNKPPPDLAPLLILYQTFLI